ncbi:MAG TPA: anti-sigma factor [Ktedonobacterales bacterium]|jgi:predicted anti-sigma-YlaC factor YlaD
MNTANELSCKEVVELVTGYLEHALLAETQAHMEAHLADCPGCRTYLLQIQQTITLLRALSQEPAFPETKEHLLRLFEQWKNSNLAQ